MAANPVRHEPHAQWLAAPRVWYRCEYMLKSRRVCGNRTLRGRVCGKHTRPEGWNECAHEACVEMTASKYGYCAKHARRHVVQAYRQNVKAIRAEAEHTEEMNAYIDGIVDAWDAPAPTAAGGTKTG